MAVLRLSIFLLLLSFSLTAQRNPFPVSANALTANGKKIGHWTLLYTKEWKQVIDPDSAEFYRLIYFEEGIPSGKVRDFFRNGTKQWEGYLQSVDPDIKVNEAKYYFENGKVQYEVVYKNNLLDGPLKEYNPQGKLLSQGHMKSDTAYGQWSTYREDGSLFTVNIRKHDVVDGPLTVYYSSGKVEKKGTKKMGKTHGWWDEFYENGTLKSHEYFEHDLMEGLAETYYENGQLETKGTYLHGNKIGEWWFYYENGVVSKTGLYDSAGNTTGLWQYNYTNGNRNLLAERRDGKLHGLYEDYYESGKLKSKSQCVNDLWQGNFEAYFENGVLSKKGNYIGDSLTGEWVYYNENGTLVVQGSFIDNKKNGKWIYNFPNGQTESLENFVLGALEGAYESYHENGVLANRKTYHHNQFHGLSESYYNNGQLESVGVYINGKRNGLWKWYHANGQLKTEENYSQGIWDGPYTEYHVNGNKKSEGTAVKQLREGAYTGYYYSGSKRSSGHYKNDVRDGYWIYYDSLKGFKESEGLYVAGKFHKQWKFYDERGKRTGIGYYTNGFLENFFSLEDSLKTLSQLGLIEKEWEVVKRLDEVRKRDSPKNELRKNMMYFWKGYVYGDAGKHEEAIAEYASYIRGLRKLKADTSFDYSSAINNMAISYSALGKHHEALAHYNDLTPFYSKRKIENRDEVVHHCNIAYERGKLYHLRDQERYLIKYKDSREKTSRVNPENTLILLNNLGTFYLNDTSLYDQAICTYEQILSLTEKQALEKKDRYGLALYNIGLAHRAKYNFTEAIRWFKKAEQFFATDLSSWGGAYLNVLDRMGNTYVGNRQLDSTRMTYTRMLNTIEKLGWQHDRWQALALDGLAEVYHYEYEEQKAYEIWMEAKQLLEKLNMENSILYADILQSLSICLPLVHPAEVAVAERYLLKSLGLMEKIQGKGWQYRNILMALAEFYTGRDQYEKAYALLQEVLTLTEQIEGKQSLKYAAALNSLGDLYYEQESYSKAIDSYQKAIPIARLYEKNNPNTLITILANLSAVERKLLHYEVAEKYQRESMQLTKNTNGLQSTEYITKLLDMAFLKRSQNLYTEAEHYYIEALHRTDTLMGKKSFRYASIVRNLGKVYQDNAQYKKAEAQYKLNQQLVLELVGEKSSENLLVISDFALLYKYMDKLKEAEAYYLQSVSLGGEVFGNSSMEYAYKLSNTSNFYFQNNQLFLAEKYGRQAIDIALSVLGENSIAYAGFLLDMASIYMQVDKNKEAEEAYLKAIAIYKINQVDNFGGYIAALQNIQGFYLKFGQHEDALHYSSLALTLIDQRWGKEYKYAENLLSRARIHFEVENYDSARHYATQGLLLFTDIVSPNHWQVLEAHNILGLADIKQQNLTEAEQHFRFCIEQRNLSHTAGSFQQASSLHNLAAVLLERGEFIQAEKLYNQSKALSDSLQIEDANTYASYHLNKAKLYNAWGKPALAEKHMSLATERIKAYVMSNFYFLSDNEKAQYWKNYRFYFEYFQSMAVQHSKQNPSLLGDLYNLQLETKGILLSTSNKIRKRILSSGDSLMTNQYYQWVNQRNQLAQWYTLSKEEQKKNKLSIDSLELLSRKIEKELNITAEEVEKDRGKSITWRDVQKALKPDEAAIEFMRVRHHTTRPTDSIVYVALILTSEMTKGPALAVLPDGITLEGRVYRYYKNAMQAQVTDTSSYHQYWAAVAPFVKTKNRLYISLDGVYNSINLNSLLLPNNNFLADEKTISLLANTKELVLLKKSSVRFTRINARLFGFPKYFLGADKMKEKAGEERNADLSLLSTEDNSGIASLPGTKTEIEKVSNILESHHWQVNSMLDEHATEEAVKEIRQPRLLHIATHGFFTDERSSSTLGTNDPMLRAGLLFSGAANFVQDHLQLPGDNGILTAYEAANLNLDNTEMVVLSACETAKGEIQNGEGVYGLQRAFQTAGAKSIIMSLWKVDDAATQKLMTGFYEQWTSGKTKSEAFKTAQLNLKKEYPHPYYWGAFVLMGE